MLENARLERKNIIDSAEPEIISLALKMAEKIVQQELKLDNSLLVAMLRGIKMEMGDLGDGLVIRLAPELLPIMQAQKEALQLIFPLGNFILQPDPKVEEGFILDTEIGAIDARVTTQLGELEKALKEVLSNEK